MKLVLKGFCILLFLACLIPPWVQVVHRGQVRGSEPLGYAWIFRPPRPRLPPITSPNPRYDWNFDPDAPKINPAWNALPEADAAPAPFANKGVAVALDFGRLGFEILGLLALGGLGLAFAWRRRQ